MIVMMVVMVVMVMMVKIVMMIVTVMMLMQASVYKWWYSDIKKATCEFHCWSCSDEVKLVSQVHSNPLNSCVCHQQHDGDHFDVGVDVAELRNVNFFYTDQILNQILPHEKRVHCDKFNT